MYATRNCRFREGLFIPLGLFSRMGYDAEVWYISSPSLHQPSAEILLATYSKVLKCETNLQDHGR